MQFKWADSKTTYDEMEDFYIDGDCAPLGRLNYVYQNYIPGVSEITYPEVEEDTSESATVEEPTNDPTEQSTDPSEAPSAEVSVEDTVPDESATASVDNATEANTENTASGCASVASLSALSILGIMSLGAVLTRKKKD